MQITFNKKPIMLSRSAMHELTFYGCDLMDIIEILKNGYQCFRSNRAKDTIEKCIDRKGKTWRVVVVGSFNYDLNREVWVVTHFGITSRRRN